MPFPGFRPGFMAPGMQRPLPPGAPPTNLPPSPFLRMGLAAGMPFLQAQQVRVV